MSKYLHKEDFEDSSNFVLLYVEFNILQPSIKMLMGLPTAITVASTHHSFPQKFKQWVIPQTCRHWCKLSTTKDQKRPSNKWQALALYFQGIKEK